MIYLPDTNVFSAHFSNRSPALSARLEEEMSAGNLVLSVMVLAELEFGAYKAERTLGHTRFTRAVRSLTRYLPPESLGETFAPNYAKIRYQLERRGAMIGDRDQIIAAHALCLNAAVVTRNVREFQRVTGLKVENWQPAD